MKRQTLLIATFLAASGLAGTPARAGTETTLYAFSVGSPAPSLPEGTLLVGRSGIIYGTTFIGGAFGEGTVFKLSPDGNLILLHEFSGSPDAAEPRAGVIRDVAGNLYGDTNEGGVKGTGAIFAINTAGQERVASTPSSGQDQGPNGGLLFYSSSSVIAPAQGTRKGGGVMQVMADGNVTTRTTFSGQTVPQGTYFGTLAMDSQATVYGVAGGGTNQQGCVYSLTATNVLSIFYSFLVDNGVPRGCYAPFISSAACLSMYPTKAMTWKPASVAA